MFFFWFISKLVEENTIREEGKNMNNLLFLLELGSITQQKRLSLYPLTDIFVLSFNDYLTLD